MFSWFSQNKNQNKPSGEEELLQGVVYSLGNGERGVMDMGLSGIKSYNRVNYYIEFLNNLKQLDMNKVDDLLNRLQEDVPPPPYSSLAQKRIKPLRRGKSNPKRSKSLNKYLAAITNPKQKKKPIKRKRGSVKRK